MRLGGARRLKMRVALRVGSPISARTRLFGIELRWPRASLNALRCRTSIFLNWVELYGMAIAPFSIELRIRALYTARSKDGSAPHQVEWRHLMMLMRRLYLGRPLFLQDTTLHTQLYTAQFYIHTTLYSTNRHATTRHITIRHDTFRHSTIRHFTTRSGKTWHATTRHVTPRHDKTRHAIIWYGAIRHATTRHNYNWIRYNSTRQ